MNPAPIIDEFREARSNAQLMASPLDGQWCKPRAQFRTADT
jgi:hypothetical protein